LIIPMLPDLISDEAYLAYLTYLASKMLALLDDSDAEDAPY
jgi:hypothetical protein